MIVENWQTAAGEVTTCFVGKKPEWEKFSDEERYHKLRSLFDNKFSLLFVKQVHGNRCLVGTDAKGTLHFLGEADAIVAIKPQLAPLVRTADCIPLLFYACHRPHVGAIHAGWRGLRQRVFTATMAELEKLQVPVSDLRFVAGPFIGENSYEVGCEVAECFAPAFSVRKNNGKYLLDLRRVLEQEMADCGILPEQVIWHGIDTLRSPQWYSARRGDSLRNYALVWRA
ncbi:MAG: polyphenol oxidase family protein [Turneriella sp.]|nr:polyphenol oxidase family protein [Turneriella sp.]